MGNRSLMRCPIFSEQSINDRLHFRRSEWVANVLTIWLGRAKSEISDIQLIDCAYPDFTLDIRCGSGTYVRSLGRDIAAALSTHAVMTALVRTEIGDFHQSDATPLNDFDSNPIERFLLPPESILGMMPRTVLVDDEFDKLQDGNWIRRDLPPEVEDLAAMDDAGRLVVVLKKDSGRLFVPKINFARHWKANQDQA
jgi:tRNA pseudouridine55 synthase